MLYAKAMRMIRTVICIISHTHTCWVCTFSCLSRERAVHYMIVLIPIVFPYTLVSNCYHSWSFANIIVLCRLGSVHVVFLSYYYRERTKLICKMFMIRSFPNKNWCEFQNFHIRPRSAVDSAQWDWGIRGANLLRLCPSLTMPNLLPNEDELTIQLFTGDHSWSFLVILTMKMTMTIYSNSVLLMHVASASQHKGFEHVQKLCVPIVNNFHSCLCALKSVIIVFVTQLTCCILVILNTTSFVHVIFQTNGVRMWLELCRLIVFLSYYYRERTELKWKIYMIRHFPNKNCSEFQFFYIRPRSAVDSAQWDHMPGHIVLYETHMAHCSIRTK